MSWSLQLRNGDLVTGGARLAQVVGSNKLVQDLRCALLEPRAHDDMHPSFGSTLDGGRDSYGNIAPSVIGETDWEYASMVIEGEIRRIAGDHQRRQLARAGDDRSIYGESTLSNSELLLSINDVEFFQSADALLVKVHVLTGVNTTRTLEVALDGMITF